MLKMQQYIKYIDFSHVCTFLGTLHAQILNRMYLAFDPFLQSPKCKPDKPDTINVGFQTLTHGLRFQPSVNSELTPPKSPRGEIPRKYLSF